MALDLGGNGWAPPLVPNCVYLGLVVGVAKGFSVPYSDSLLPFLLL